MALMPGNHAESVCAKDMIIIIMVISTARYLADNDEYTALDKINKIMT